MFAKDAKEQGYRINNKEDNVMGYEITYLDGYKSWIPKEEADKSYFKLLKENGNIIFRSDVERFIRTNISQTINEKTTLVDVKLITDFNIIETSSCVDPKNYNLELGEKYATEKVINKIYEYLGFVLQWAKNGLKY